MLSHILLLMPLWGAFLVSDRSTWVAAASALQEGKRSPSGDLKNAANSKQVDSTTSATTLKPFPFACEKVKSSSSSNNNNNNKSVEGEEDVVECKFSIPLNKKIEQQAEANDATDGIVCLEEGVCIVYRAMISNDESTARDLLQHLRTQDEDNMNRHVEWGHEDEMLMEQHQDEFDVQDSSSLEDEAFFQTDEEEDDDEDIDAVESDEFWDMDHNAENLPDVIHVGSLQFHKPFEAYGPFVHEALVEYPLDSNTNDENQEFDESEDGMEEQIEYTDWLVSLGVAIRQQAQTDGLPAVPLTSLDALEVFQLALRNSFKFPVLQDFLNDTPFFLDLNAESALMVAARTHEEMAESYLSSDFDYNEADQHFQDAIGIYRFLVAQEYGDEESEYDDNDYFDWHVGNPNFKLADLLVRLGVMKTNQLVQEQSSAQSSSGTIDLTSIVSNMADTESPKIKVVSDLSHFSKIPKTTKPLFQEAVKIYKAAWARIPPLNVEYVYTSYETDQVVALANKMGKALQNLASISSFGPISGASSDSLALIEESIRYYERAFALKRAKASSEYEELAAGLAEGYYSLAESYLQSGKYKRAASTYRKSMKMYELHNLEPPSIAVMGSMGEKGTDFTNVVLAQQEEILASYEQGTAFGEGTSSAKTMEAELHASIGSLRLARNELEWAMVHLSKALDLQELYGTDERVIGDIKLQVATVLFRQRKFTESSEAHEEATNIFAQFVEEGKNPLLAGLEGMLKEAGVDTGDISTLTQAMLNLGQASEDDDGDSHQDDDDDKEQEQASVDTIKQRLINLDMSRSKLMNATVMDEQ